MVCRVKDTPVSEVTMQLGRHKTVKTLHPLYPYRFEKKDSEQRVYNKIDITRDQGFFSYSMAFTMMAIKDENDNDTSEICMTRQKKPGKFTHNFHAQSFQD